MEVIAVALAVAMGFRTYFIQPFKIPTGSMQPTLYGITVQPQVGKQWHDHFPLNLVSMALVGAIATWRCGPKHRGGGLPGGHERGKHRWSGWQRPDRTSSRATCRLPVTPGQSRVTKGQILACGRVRLGDHIFVNKVRYNFSRPERGDIFVFSTPGHQVPADPARFLLHQASGRHAGRFTATGPAIPGGQRETGDRSVSFQASG